MPIREAAADVVLAAEDRRDMAEVECVAVGLDGERVADHDDDQNKDEAVLGPYTTYCRAKAFFLVFHIAASSIVSMALVE